MGPGPFVPALSPVGPDEFVRYWSGLYDYPNSGFYEDNVGKPLTTERIRGLFKWKNGGKLPESSRQSVEVNFVERAPELEALSGDTDPGSFLDRFAEGGAIFRIFWLHLWRPDRYPIFDQHVYRAMRLVLVGRLEEIPSYDPRKIEAYIDEYLPFVRTGFQGLELRQVDRALWACGKIMKAHGSADLRISRE